jgi:hypothetical protein
MRTYDICIYGYFNTNHSKCRYKLSRTRALSPESMKELSLNMENLSINLINYTGYQFYSPL